MPEKFSLEDALICEPKQLLASIDSGDFKAWKLLQDAYRNPELAEQRRKLLEYTFAHVSTPWTPWYSATRRKREQAFNLDTLDPIITDIGLQVILKIRYALKHMEVVADKADTYKKLMAFRDMAIKVGDGDFAYSTATAMRGDITILGVMELEEFVPYMIFSPELQHDIALRDPEYFKQSLARNRFLTDEAQLLLLEHPDPEERKSINSRNASGILVWNRYAHSLEMMKKVFEIPGGQGDEARMELVFSDRKFPDEILALIARDPTLDLIYRAKTDPDAEFEMIDEARRNGDALLLKFVIQHAKLHTRTAFQALGEIQPNLLWINPHATRYNDVGVELTGKLS